MKTTLQAIFFGLATLANTAGAITPEDVKQKQTTLCTQAFSYTESLKNPDGTFDDTNREIAKEMFQRCKDSLENKATMYSDNAANEIYKRLHCYSVPLQGSRIMQVTSMYGSIEAEQAMADALVEYEDAPIGQPIAQENAFGSLSDTEATIFSEEECLGIKDHLINIITQIEALYLATFGEAMPEEID